jgi:hypothetical protein
MATLILPKQTRLDCVSALTASGGPFYANEVHCFKVLITPSDQTKLSDVIGPGIESDFDGYAPQTLTWSGDVYYNSQGVAYVFGAACNFQSAPDQSNPQTIFGVSYVQALTPVAAPAGPSATLAAGGTLPEPQEFFYVVTAFIGPSESVGSTEVNATTTSVDKTINLAWSAVAGATGYKVYRGTATGAENLLIATIEPGSTLTYSDNGSSAGTPATPPVSPPTSILRGVLLFDVPVPINNFPDGVPFIPAYQFAG